MVGDVAILDVVTGRAREFGGTERVAESLIHAHNVPRVLVDLSCVDFMNSELIAKLLGLHRRIQDAKGRLILCGLSEFVRDTFATSKLNQAFDIANDEENALASL